MFEGVADLINLAPGVRARLTFEGKDGKEHVLLDVRNPEFDTEDDGSKGEQNKRNWYLICYWFPGEVFLQRWFSSLYGEIKEPYEVRIRELEAEIRALKGGE